MASTLREVITRDIQNVRRGVGVITHAKVVAWDHELKLAAVEYTKPGTNILVVDELPWVIESSGIIPPAPKIGTYVTIGFVHGNTECPYIISQSSLDYKRLHERDSERSTIKHTRLLESWIR